MRLSLSLTYVGEYLGGVANPRVQWRWGKGAVSPRDVRFDAVTCRAVPWVRDTDEPGTALVELPARA
jgi:hypothetical protein